MFLTGSAAAPPTGVPDLQPLVTALQGAITPAQMITILVSIVGVGMSFVLMWFGARKAVRIFSSALTKGKLRI